MFEAWKLVKSTTIINCWKKCGFLEFNAVDLKADENVESDIKREVDQIQKLLDRQMEAVSLPGKHDKSFLSAQSFVSVDEALAVVLSPTAKEIAARYNATKKATDEARETNTATFKLLPEHQELKVLSISEITLRRLNLFTSTVAKNYKIARSRLNDSLKDQRRQLGL